MDNHPHHQNMPDYAEWDLSECFQFLSKAIIVTRFLVASLDRFGPLLVLLRACTDLCVPAGCDCCVVDKFVRSRDVGPPPPPAPASPGPAFFDAIPPPAANFDVNHHHRRHHQLGQQYQYDDIVPCYATPHDLYPEYRLEHTDEGHSFSAHTNHSPFARGLAQPSSHHHHKPDPVLPAFMVTPAARPVRQPQLPSLASLPDVPGLPRLSRLAGPANPSLPPLAAWSFGELPPAPQEPNADDFRSFRPGFDAPSAPALTLPPIPPPQHRRSEWAELPDLLPTSDEPHFPSDFDFPFQDPSHSSAMPTTRQRSAAAARAAPELLDTPTPAPRGAKRRAVAGDDEEVELLGTPTAASRAKRPRVARPRSDLASPSSSRKATPKKRRSARVPDSVFDSDEEDGVEVVNLVDDELPKEEEPQPAAPKQPSATLLRFGTQSCVICFENLTDIVVTHCGKLHCLAWSRTFLTRVTI